MALNDWMQNAGANRDIPAGVQNAATQVGQFAAQQAEALRRAQAAQQQAQQVLDQQNLSVLEGRLVELTAQEQAAMNAPRVVVEGGRGTEPIAVQHHLSEVLVALLAPAGGELEIIPAARHLLVTSPQLRNDAGFLERARESDRCYRATVDRYGDVLRSVNDPAWWQSAMAAAGMTNSVSSQENWQGNYSAGVREVVATSVPVIMGVRVADTGLRIRITGIPGLESLDRDAAREELRAVFSGAGIDADRLVLTEDGRGNIVLDFRDAALETATAVAAEEPIVSEDANPAD